MTSRTSRNGFPTEDDTMYAFASGITTAMLSGIGVAIGIMVCMTVFALFHRTAMGGKQDDRFIGDGQGGHMWS